MILLEGGTEPSWGNWNTKEVLKGVTASPSLSPLFLLPHHNEGTVFLCSVFPAVMLSSPQSSRTSWVSAETSEPVRQQTFLPPCWFSQALWHRGRKLTERGNSEEFRLSADLHHVLTEGAMFRERLSFRALANGPTASSLSHAGF